MEGEGLATGSASSSSRSSSQGTNTQSSSAVVGRPLTDKEKRGGSEFLCKVRYFNNLPPVPFDAKFLEYPFDDMRFVRYTATSLERNYKWVLHTEQDLGIPINLIDPHVYTLGDQKAPVNEIDERLMTADEHTNGIPKKSEHARPSVKWLRKTEYLSSESWGYSNVPASMLSKFGKRPQVDLEKDEVTVEQIEQTFLQAKEAPKHPSDPSLTPVEVYDVFPGFDLWSTNFSQVTFDGPPISKELSKEEQEFCENNAIVKGWKSSEENFVAFLVPKKRKAPDEPLFPSDVDEAEAEYDWLREYKYDIKSKEDEGKNPPYFFIFSGDAVSYNRLESRVQLTKFKPKDIQYPISITVKLDDFQQDEISQREEKIQHLQRPDGSVFPNIRREGPVPKKLRLSEPEQQTSPPPASPSQGENKLDTPMASPTEKPEKSDNEESE